MQPWYTPLLKLASQGLSTEAIARKLGRSPAWVDWVTRTSLFRHTLSQLR